MSFFDDKQEAINIELTPYGKLLLSKGKFKPYYYSFFDDDIIYDSKYANFTENQNDIQERILSFTAFLKSQAIFNTVDTTPKILKDINPDRNIINYISLGNSAASSEYAPSWNLNFISGQISYSQQYDENNLKIPQIYLYNTTCKIKIIETTDSAPDNYYYIGSFQTQKKSLDAFYKENDIFIDVTELNAYDSLENYDIEVYKQKINENVLSTSEKIEWEQLNFSKDINYIKDNILLDSPSNMIPIKNLENNPTYVEHYLNILIDDEIELSPELKTNIKIYDTPSTNGPFGEDC